MECTCYLLIHEKGKIVWIKLGDTFFMVDVLCLDLARHVIVDLTNYKLVH
jgi:hypothetical protein